jgi:hypothetical protein
MRYPQVYTARAIQRWDVEMSLDGKSYTPARPLSLNRSIFKRLLLAWKVFTGRYDILDWEDH